MILDKEQLKQLSVKTKTDLLMVLYEIEDELDYECEDISETINYLQVEKVVLFTDEKNDVQDIMNF